MAWSDLASNELVSFTNAQTSGFTLKAGQSHVTSNEIMTKLDATTKYNLNPTPLTSYVNNRCIPKSVWSAPLTFHAIGNCYNTGADSGFAAACAVTGSETYYNTTGNPGWAVFDLIYKSNGDGTYSALTIPPGVASVYVSYTESGVRTWIRVFPAVDDTTRAEDKGTC